MIYKLIYNNKLFGPLLTAAAVRARICIWEWKWNYVKRRDGAYIGWDAYSDFQLLAVAPPIRKHKNERLGRPKELKQHTQSWKANTHVDHAWKQTAPPAPPTIPHPPSNVSTLYPFWGPEVPVPRSVVPSRTGNIVKCVTRRFLI